MLRLHALVAATLLALPVANHAQVISGRVIEEESGSAIAGVAISFTARNGQLLLGGTLTDSTGAFFFRSSMVGNIQLKLTHPSYLSPDPVNVTLSATSPSVVELRMSRAAIPLRPVIVGGERDMRLSGFRERLRSGGGGQFITREDIDRRPGTRTTDLLRELHGVEIVQTGGGVSRPRVNLIAFRGGRGRCMATIYIDGIVVGQFPESGLDDFLRPETIEGVEVYTGSNSAPAELRPRDGCGVVAFWTRPVEVREGWSMKRLLLGGASLAALGLIILLSR